MNHEHELIDRTDNDSHDTGTEEEMQAEAAVRNRDETPGGRWSVYYPRWIVRPQGFAEANYNEGENA